MEMDLERSSTTTFNMGIATLQRIDELLRVLSMFNIKGWLFKTKPIIRELYKELYPFLKADEKKIGDKKLLDIYTYTIQRGQYSDEILISNKLLPAITDFDFWIRDRLKEKKLLMSMAEDPTQALGR